MEEAPSNTPRSRGEQRLAAVILGNDAVVAARPNTPAQLAHACAAAGFDIVVPPSWGDELVAGALLTGLAARREHVVIACTCPRVAALLGGMPASLPCGRLAVASPPVAAARYLREVHSKPLLITYVGDCPSASDRSIDAQLSPAAFLARLEREAISLDAQPDVMEPVVADRWLRYASVPGGLPALRFIGRPPVSRVFRAVAGDVSSITALGATRTDVVGDLAEAAHCVCGGDRDSVEELEPVRSTAPVVARLPGLDLEPPATLPPVRGAVESEGSAEPAVAGQPAQPLATIAPALAVAAPPPPPPAHPVAPPPLVTRANSSPMPILNGRPHHRRQALLAAIPALVLVAAGALGMGAYAIGRSHARPAASGVEVSTRPEEIATQPDDQDAPGPPAESLPNDSGAAPPGSTAAAATAPTDSAMLRSRVTPTEDSTRAADGASASSSARRPRRVQVVPGWLPQGARTWTPSDSTSARKPDSVPRPPAPATPDTSRFDETKPDSSRAEA